MYLVPAKNSINVRMSGGLGNQLFQLGNALRVANKFGVEIQIDISWFKHNYMKSEKVQSRSFELDYFPNLESIARTFTNKPFFDKKMGSIQRRLSGRSQLKIGILSEKNISFFEGLPKYIDGVFVNKLFLLEDLKLIEYLKLPTEHSEWLNKHFNEIKGTQCVAVHVRMGDYLNLKEIYGVITPGYYQKAIAVMKLKFPNSKLFLFSDSPNEAADWLGSNIVFDSIVISPKEQKAGELLHFMASFNGLICANSTFSWWAGYLGTKSLKMESVIFPKKYSNTQDENVEKSLKLQNWELI